MCRIILFAGTTEGREIAEFLDKKQVPARVCVATEYGEELLPKSPFLQVSHERLDEPQMEQLFKEQGARLVLDATHPYAAQVTENIKTACEKCGVSYVRILRENEGSEELSHCVYTDTVEEAVEFLEKTQGNILVTTGSKEAAKYTALSGYQKRVFLRILSVPQAVEQCARLGFEGRNLICMQGPFSLELNTAMLRQYDCRYLVTKMSGNTGGFLEKIRAAKDCGCTLVVIGRPVKEEGISVKETKRLLYKKLSLQADPEIFLVGIGMGDRKSRTLEADRVLDEADLIIGARRMVEACAKKGQDTWVEYDSQKILAYIQAHPEYEKVAVVLSGDTGFYSGAKKLADALGGRVRLLCGIASPVYFMSRIGLSWDDAVLASAHGKTVNLTALIRQNRKVFAILGTRDGVAGLAKKLTAYGMGEVTLYVGENLSYPEEKISSGPARDFTDYEASVLSVVCAVNEKAQPLLSTHGLSDETFLRDKVPMTKEEVRTVSLSKLRLQTDSVCWDVGAGTGSVSVEMALRAWNGRVYAIEKKEAAVQLIEKNKNRFAADNLTVIEGTAPEALEELEAPTHAFIGGSSGNLKAIMECLLRKNPRVRVVINCIALESMAETLRCLKELPVTEAEMVQLCVSRAKTAGPYHMMMGENPIYIISCTGTGAGLE